MACFVFKETYTAIKHSEQANLLHKLLLTGILSCHEVTKSRGTLALMTFMSDYNNIIIFIQEEFFILLYNFK